MKTLTPRQKDILEYVRDYISSRGYSPSYREIKEHFGFSSLGSVHKFIHALKTKGVLEGEKHRSRAIILTEDHREAERSNNIVEIPFMGNLSTNAGIESLPQMQLIQLTTNLAPVSEKSYALRVIGDFLLEEQISNGDMLIVETGREPKNGEMVLLKVKNCDITLKYYYQEERQYIRLEGHSAGSMPIVVRRQDVMIYGVLVSLMRSY